MFAKTYTETPFTSEGDGCKTGGGAGKKREWGERERERARNETGEAADIAAIFPLRGAGAEGPSAVIYNRTRIFVNAQVP